MKTRIACAAALGGLFLLLAVGGQPRPPMEAPGGPSKKPGLLQAEARKLKTTVVTPVLETPLAKRKNVLWCGAFQLAWNEARALAGGELGLEPAHPMADALNLKSFTGQDLDEASYVALAGLVKDDIYGRIQRALAEKFAGQARPELAGPSPEPHGPQDLVAYAYLFKNLQFEVPFGNGEEPLHFGSGSVACFGTHAGLTIGFRHAPPDLAKMSAQVLILDYRDPNDFVIELKTKSRNDRLLLAKIKPAATLAATLAAVRGRVAQQPGIPGTPVDIFLAPKLNFDITRNYHELLGRRLVHHNPQLARDLRLVGAVQNIRFQMDERGVVLRSEARVHGGCSAPPPPPKHIMVFDRPFLIVMERVGASAPYFALWVENPELLVPW